MTLAIRAVRGRAEDPRWVRPTLFALLVGTGLLYIVRLDKVGWGNSFYAAAAQSGTMSWKAFLFGSSDPGNTVTVDKPAAALWPMEIFSRIFGFNSWTMLIPEALMGVASVGLLYLVVRRWSSPAAGLIAGLILALTPVATQMFRYNNPDAFMVFLMVAAAYAIARALTATGKSASLWIFAAGLLFGFAFITKMLQPFTALPAFIIAYALCANPPLLQRLKHLGYAAGGVVLGGGWWVAIVQLWPANNRPYIDNSQNNSILNLIFGYNGLGRLSGNESTSVTAGTGGRADDAGGSGAFGGGGRQSGIFRLFESQMGTNISWLLPAAIVLLIAGFWLTRTAPRTDVTRVGLILFGGWLICTGLVLSFSQGIINAYYTLEIAPAIAAIIGIGLALSWQHRHALGSVVIGAALVITSIWAFVLLSRNDANLPQLRWTVLILGVAAAIALIAGAFLPRQVSMSLAAVGLVLALVGPAIFSLRTAENHNAIGNNMASLTTSDKRKDRATTTNYQSGAADAIMTTTKPTAAVTKKLLENSTGFTWIAATISSNQAAGYQLATSRAVMPIGGFRGTDPAPTLAEFQQDTKQQKIHYLLLSSSTNSRFRSSASTTAAQITQWVEQNFSPLQVGSVTLYDLTEPKLK